MMSADGRVTLTTSAFRDLGFLSAASSTGLLQLSSIANGGCGNCLSHFI